MRLRWTCAVLLAACATTPEPAPAGPARPRTISLRADAIGGCDPSVSESGVTFQCGAVTATAAETEGDDVPRLLSGVLLRLKKNLDAGASFESRADDRSFGGRSWTGVTFTNGAAGQAALEGALYAGPAAPGTVRMLLCLGPPDRLAARCPAFFESFATGPLPKVERPPEPHGPESFAGAPVPVPPGCERHDPDADSVRIVCPDHSLFARRFDDLDHAQAFVALATQSLLEGLGDASPGEPAECVIGGVSTVCAVVSGQEETRPVRALLGAAGLPDQAWAALCVSPAGAPVPAACAAFVRTP